MRGDDCIQGRIHAGLWCPAEVCDLNCVESNYEVRSPLSLPSAAPRKRFRRPPGTLRVPLRPVTDEGMIQRQTPRGPAPPTPSAAFPAPTAMVVARSIAAPPRPHAKRPTLTQFVCPHTRPRNTHPPTKRSPAAVWRTPTKRCADTHECHEHHVHKHTLGDTSARSPTLTPAPAHLRTLVYAPAADMPHGVASPRRLGTVFLGHHRRIHTHFFPWHPVASPPGP